MNIKYKLIITSILTIVSCVGAVVFHDNWLIGYITGGLLMATVIYVFNGDDFKSLFVTHNKVITCNTDN